MIIGTWLRWVRRQFTPVYDLTGVELWAPTEFKQASPAQIEALCNACGPGNWIQRLVSDNFYELGPDISTVCNIHDWMYTFPEDAGQEYKDKADRVFKNNLIRTAEAAQAQDLTYAETRSGWVRWWYRLQAEKLYITRMRLAEIYYTAVATFGGPAFWRGKNKPEEIVNAAS
jgi:hypothetical protein